MFQSMAIPGAIRAHRWQDVAFACAFALIAPLFAVVTWQPIYSRTLIRDLSVPVLFGEVLLILVLLGNGPPVVDRLRSASRLTMTACAAWLALAAMSTIMASADPASARFHYCVTLLHTVFGFALWNYLGSHPKLPRILWPALTFSLAAFTIVVVGLSLSVENRTGFDWAHFGAGVTNVRHFGFYGLILTGLAAGLTAFGKHLIAPKAGLALLGAGLFLVFWSGSRAAFLGLLTQFAVLALALPRGERTDFLIHSAGLSALAIPLSIWLAPSSLFGAAELLGRLNPMAEVGAGGFSSGRFEVWRETVAQIWLNPWIGHGEAQFRWVVEAAGNRLNTPHSLPLQLLFQWGLLGSAAFAILVFRLTAPALRASAPPQFQTMTAVAVLVGLTVMALLDGPFFYPYPVLVAAAGLAVIASDNRKEASAP